MPPLPHRDPGRQHQQPVGRELAPSAATRPTSAGGCGGGSSRDGPGFKYQAVVRKKAEREKLQVCLVVQPGGSMGPCTPVIGNGPAEHWLQLVCPVL